MKRTLPILLLSLFLATSFFHKKRLAPPAPPCDPKEKVFRGYSFILPEVVNKKAAYAPYFLQFGGMYDAYFKSDLQKLENAAEWNERFCTYATQEEAEHLVYKTGISEINSLLSAAADESQKMPLPHSLAQNALAQTISFNNCTEACEYLIYAKRCEPFCLPKDAWDSKGRDSETMKLMVNEGKERFAETKSHFFRLRYAYQMIRLLHYAGDYQGVVNLYNKLMPQIDRRKPSVIYYWSLGHLAGALQKLGKNAEAAYRYALIFRDCPGKRTSAFRSFRINNDTEWKHISQLCQTNDERFTVRMLREVKMGNATAATLRDLYALEPENPNLELLLIRQVQNLERAFLRTEFTDKKQNQNFTPAQIAAASRSLYALSAFVDTVAPEKKCANPKLWRCISDYLELLKGAEDDHQTRLEATQKTLNQEDIYEKSLFEQIDVWLLLDKIQKIEPTSKLAEDEIKRIQGYQAYADFPAFEAYLNDRMASRLKEGNKIGEAFLEAFGVNDLKLNPRPDVVNDLLREAIAAEQQRIKSGIIDEDTVANMQTAVLLEIKGTYLMSIGEEEAAFSAFRSIKGIEDVMTQTYSPFKENFRECVMCPVSDSVNLNKINILRKMRQYEVAARASVLDEKPDAAHYYYLLGIAWYNTSFFGHANGAMDYFRNPQTWNNLRAGEIQPLSGTPHGNREVLDMSKSLEYFRQALAYSTSREGSARICFMAARCQQKEWFCDPACKYRPGMRQVPAIPNSHRAYYNLLKKEYADTEFYKLIVKECKWLKYY